jgi:hypothetical protein
LAKEVGWSDNSLHPFAWKVVLSANPFPNDLIPNWLPFGREIRRRPLHLAASVIKTRFLFAVDDGPRQALATLASVPGYAWIESAHMGSVEQWRGRFTKSGARALIVGTSRSTQGAHTEAQCRMAARQLGLPVVAIEDYPGNYQHVRDAAADLLIVESELAIDAARKRLGEVCPFLKTGASFRYDALRKQGLTTEVRKAERGGWLLWAGQPETENALRSLERILPYIAELGMRLLFRAHPRDAGRARGDYSPLFKSYPSIIRDVSELSLDAVLDLKPCLTLTQFSSVAIEFGFYGVPAAYVLYPDAGAARLLALTGYETPHVCEAGGGVKILTQSDAAQVLNQAVFDQSARNLMMQRFNVFFDVLTPQTPLVARCLESFFAHYPNYK